MLLDNIQVDNMVVFMDGDEAFVDDIKMRSNYIVLLFNKEVKGCYDKKSNWCYYYNGEFIGGGNNIVKVVHMNGG